MSKSLHLEYSSYKTNKVIEQTDDSNPDPFIPGHNTLALVAKKILIGIERPDNIQYLDFGASWHFCKNRVIFKDLWPMSIKFSTASKMIFYSQKISTITICLSNKQSIELFNIALVLKCKFNLISLVQLWETGIIYYDESIRMTLIKRKNIITHTRQDQNFFVLNLIKPKKAMIISRKGPIYIVNWNKQINIWYHWLGHINNIRVVKVSKIVNGININNAKYNPKKVFIDSDLSKTGKQPNVIDKNLAHLADSAFSSYLLKDTTLSNFDQLCDSCIRSKSTKTVL